MKNKIIFYSADKLQRQIIQRGVRMVGAWTCVTHRDYMRSTDTQIYGHITSHSAPRPPVHIIYCAG